MGSQADSGVNHQEISAKIVTAAMMIGASKDFRELAKDYKPLFHAPKMHDQGTTTRTYNSKSDPKPGIHKARTESQRPSHSRKYQ